MATLHLEQIDSCLNLYYKQCGIDNYYNSENKRGRFSYFCISRNLSSCIKTVFKNEDVVASIEHFPFFEFDPAFPYSSMDLTKLEKMKEMQWVIQHCFVYKKPPLLLKHKYGNCKTIKPLVKEEKSKEPKYCRVLEYLCLYLLYCVTVSLSGGLNFLLTLF